MLNKGKTSRKDIIQVFSSNNTNILILTKIKIKNKQRFFFPSEINL